MHAVIISIGDELLIGQVVNTNAAYIAEKLNSIGIRVDRIVVISDDEEVIHHTLEEYFPKYDLCIMTGGLGPTHDDVTKAVICTYFGLDLVTDDTTIENIRRLMKRRNLVWTKAADEQALVPRGSVVIPNVHGTAPGILIEREGRFLAALPGVPYEMEAMVDGFLIPHFEKKITGEVIRHRTLKTTGIPESFLAQQLGNLEDILDGAKLAFLPSPRGVRLRITVIDRDAASATKKLDRVEEQIRARVGTYIFASGDEELEDVIGRLLTEQRFTLAVAESCTGGLIANRLTNVPGSSAYFERGIIAYSNRSKIETLGVAEESIQTYGAVSKEVAEAMAAGVRRLASVDIGLSTTGIAGPSGGTPDKPVGLLWVGYADQNGVLAVRFFLGDERVRFKERAAQAALELLRRKLLRSTPLHQDPA